MCTDGVEDEPLVDLGLDLVFKVMDVSAQSCQLLLYPQHAARVRDHRAVTRVPQEDVL